MKRTISLILAVISLITLSLMPISCGEPTQNESGETEATTAAAQDTGCEHNYVSVETPPTYTEKGFSTHTCEKCGNSYVDSYVDALASVVLQYDDYETALGEIKATSSSATISGDDCLEVVTKNDVTYFHAKNVGFAKVTDGSVTETVYVGKARLHFVVIMGQSNAGNHFSNAISDVVCELGTAYWWAVADYPFSYANTPSMGFHTPLVAELRAQSVAAGSPEKPVLIWYEGITSKDGKAITAWATSATDTSGTDATVDMIKKCTDYFTAPERADKYEIVEKGMYWLQGEGGHDPVHYKECFMAMWNRLKTAGIEYCAFLRVRRGSTFNQTVLTDHNDLSYHGTITAQIDMVNENNDMYLATTITENWIGKVTDKHSVDISNYITMMEFYGKSENYSDKHGNTATFKDGILTTTMKELYGQNNLCHYGKFGYGIIGADAAYNMYRALHEDKFAIVCTDTTGMVKGQTTTEVGETVTIDALTMTKDLIFRPACYSTGGKLKVDVYKGKTKITNTPGVILNDANNYKAVCAGRLSSYDDITIIVTYTTTSGESGTVTYEMVR